MARSRCRACGTGPCPVVRASHPVERVARRLGGRRSAVSSAEAPRLRARHGLAGVPTIRVRPAALARGGCMPARLACAPATRLVAHT